MKKILSLVLSVLFFVSLGTMCLACNDKPAYFFDQRLVQDFYDTCRYCLYTEDYRAVNDILPQAYYSIGNCLASHGQDLNLIQDACVDLTLLSNPSPCVNIGERKQHLNDFLEMLDSTGEILPYIGQ